MPRLDSSSSGGGGGGSSYFRDLHHLVTSSSPATGRRVAHLKSVLLRSVRIKLVSEGGGIGGQPSLPLRVRPAFIVLNVLDLVLLGFLGFHPNGQAWTRLNDKLLHFVCFFFATSLFYCVFDVDDAVRRIWLWRNAPLLLTFFTCFICGPIGSEIVQSFLPFKHFDPYDVLCNMLGSSLGLFFTYHLELRYRARREIERLYDPLDAEEYDDEFRLSGEDEEDEARRHIFLSSPSSNRRDGERSIEQRSEGGTNKVERKVRFGGVWEAQDDLSTTSNNVGDDDASQHPLASTPVEPATTQKKSSDQLFSIDDDGDDDEDERGNAWKDSTSDPLRS